MVVKKQSAKTAQLYAYSFDRETWQGDFNSREEAMQAAISDENTKEYLAVYTGIAKLYTPALKSETVLDILKIEADEIAGIAAADWLKLEDISEEACSELEKTLTAAVMKWLEKHSLKPDFYKLAQHIGSASWSKFFDMLTYKSVWYGNDIVKVPTMYPSSQTCSCCGFKNPLVKNLAIRKWECPECHTKHDRDTNASINILNKGLQMQSA